MAQDNEWTPVSHDTCDQVAGPFYHGTRADLAVGELPVSSPVKQTLLK